MEVGDIVEVTVTRPEVFGFFCQCGHTELLVTIPETSWIGSFNSCHQFTDPGDAHKVMVIQVDKAKPTVAASIRRMSPDPWATDSLVVGAEHSATVIRRVEHALEEFLADANYWMDMVQSCMATGYWPKNTNSCWSYNKVCPYQDLCKGRDFDTIQTDRGDGEKEPLQGFKIEIWDPVEELKINLSALDDYIVTDKE